VSYIVESQIQSALNALFQFIGDLRSFERMAEFSVVRLVTEKQTGKRAHALCAESLFSQENRRKRAAGVARILIVQALLTVLDDRRIRCVINEQLSCD
jgi:hypothetical protein